MIEAYLAAIPSLYEGEDIKIRYSLFQDDVQIKKESIFATYRKPAIVGQVSVITLLQRLSHYVEDEIVVFIHDASLNELLKGNSATKNADIKRMVPKVQEQLSKFKNLSFVNVSKDQAALEKWDERTRD